MACPRIIVTMITRRLKWDFPHPERNKTVVLPPEISVELSQALVRIGELERLVGQQADDLDFLQENDEMRLEFTGNMMLCHATNSWQLQMTDIGAVRFNGNGKVTAYAAAVLPG